MEYFEQRHILVCLYVGGKWDPRTLEAKYVRDEPFTAVFGSPVVAVNPAQLPYPRNGGFEELAPDGKTPVGWCACHI